MKKCFTPVLIAMLFASVSCQNGLTGISGGNGGDVQSVAKDEISISFELKKYSLERGSYLTLKAKVKTKDESTSKNVIYSIEQDGNIVAIEKNKDNEITISGKNVGMVIVKAICAANHDVVATATVEVIRHIPALNKVWQNVNETKNYTLETYKTKDDETESIPSSTIIVNEKAILFEAYVYEEDTEIYYTSPLYYYESLDTYILGYGIDTNGYAFPILVSSDGNLSIQNSIAKSERGFLTKENFTGFKDDSISMNDVGLFYGLQAINSSWLAKAKALKNEYVIMGDESDLASCYVKYLLWGLIDPVGRMTYSNLHPEIQDIITMIKGVNLTIKADTISQVSFTLSYDDMYIDGDIENYVYHTEMTDIGTTDCSSISGLDAFLDQTTAQFPMLSYELKLFEQGIQDHNYIFEREIYYQNATTGTIRHTPLQIFYTENYMMAYFSKDLCELIEEMGGEKTSAFGIGFLKQSDGIHMFEYDPTSSTDKISVGDLIDGTSDTEIWNVDFNLTSKYKIPNYITNSEYYTSHSLNALSDSPSLIFKGLPMYYYSHNESIFEDFSQWYLGENIQGGDFYHGVNVKMKENSTEIDSVSFLLAYEEDEYYHVIYTPTLSSFGSAESENPADSYIQEVIS